MKVKKKKKFKKGVGGWGGAWTKQFTQNKKYT